MTKIAMLRAIRARTGLGLKDAMGAFDALDELGAINPPASDSDLLAELDRRVTEKRGQRDAEFTQYSNTDREVERLERALRALRNEEDVVF